MASSIKVESFVKIDFPNLNIFNWLIAKLVFILGNEFGNNLWEIIFDKINLEIILLLICEIEDI